MLHAIEYFGLGVAVFRAVAGGLGARVTAARVKVTMLIVVAYAIRDEVISCSSASNSKTSRRAGGYCGRSDRPDRRAGVA